MNWKLKALMAGMGGIILGLLLVLVFVPSAHGPTTVLTNASSTAVTTTTMSLDGHLAVSAPTENQEISSPVKIIGTVTNGGWFFEASFPVDVIDADGTVLGRGQAQAQGNWMTTGTVPFAATINFVKSHSATGTIVFSKDNPSGLPQNAGSLAVPIMFATSTPVVIVSTSTRNINPTPTPPVFKNDSGVRGTITLGPTCPVERIPPDPQCAPKPYATQILVYSKNGSTIVATASSDAYGDYVVALPAGSYTIAPRGGGNMPPTCQPVAITITSHVFTAENLSCDTGIR